MIQEKLNSGFIINHAEFYNMVTSNPEMLRQIYLSDVACLLRRQIFWALQVDVRKDDFLQPLLHKYFDVDGLISNLRFKLMDLKFESMGGWDLTFEVLGIKFFIEYKSSCNEWGKEIPDFLKQINGRYSSYSDTVKVLATFDYDFLKYENLLKTNGIRLVILKRDEHEQR